jgi:hypothetical protein
VKHGYLRRARPDHQSAALVHEAYLSLNGQTQGHGKVGVLLAQSRTHQRVKGGGGEFKLPLVAADKFIPSKNVDVVSIDEALERLAHEFSARELNQWIAFPRWRVNRRHRQS